MVPSWTALNFPKRLVSGCKEKVERGEEFLFVEWMGLLIVIFVGGGGFTKAESFQGKTELCVWVVLRGVRERGSAFFLSFDPHSSTWG